jgi:hypothetical protein
VLQFVIKKCNLTNICIKVGSRFRIRRRKSGT